MAGPSRLEAISAVTLVVFDMERSVEFYRTLGFEPASGGAESTFLTLRVGEQRLNLMHDPRRVRRRGLEGWGRLIFRVDDVDAVYRIAVAAGHKPESAPQDAPWSERYFHLDDPDGHPLSFATPL